MENLIKQIRVKFTGAEQDNEADLGGSKDQKIPPQKTQSFKDKKKAQNWLERQLLRNMSHDHDSLEIEHATAIAAAVFAISSQEFSEKKKINEEPEGSFPKIKSKVGGVISLSSQPGGLSKRFSGSFRSSDGQGNKASIFPSTDEKKPEKALTPVSSMKKTSTSSEHLNTQDTKPQAPPPRKIPTFGDKNPKNTDDIPAPKRTPTFGDKKLTNTDDTIPGIPEPKFAPPVQSASSRPIIPPPPPPPPPHIRNTSIEPGPVRPPTPPVNTKRQTPTRVSTIEAKANAWEREELEKIKQRYEKLQETIDSWETKKKGKARRKLEKKEKSDSERKRVRAYEKFQSEMQYINGIAGGARAQAEERRRNEELKVKEKANIIRTTGKVPGTCPCF